MGLFLVWRYNSRVKYLAWAVGMLAAMTFLWILSVNVKTDRQLLEDAVSDMARGDVLFAATGVTDGNLLSGVRFGKRATTTYTVVMRASSRTVRWIKADHQDLEKFGEEG